MKTHKTEPPSGLRLTPDSLSSNTPESDRWLGGYDDNPMTLDAHKTMQNLECERDRYKAALAQILKDRWKRASSPSIIASDALQHPEDVEMKFDKPNA
jgi:hypothetical protein